MDLKAKEVRPAKLTKLLSAFSNADGGELYVGISENTRTKERLWEGFATQEDANSHIQTLEEFFPLGEYSYIFLQSEGHRGYVLQVTSPKTATVKKASDGIAYLRRGPQSLPQQTHEQMQRLERNKGITSFENETITVPTAIISDSLATVEFMIEVIPTAEPESWLKKQLVIRDNKPTVAGIILFADEPQAVLPKRCGVKIYRYATSEPEGTRETLVFDPFTIEGHAYSQIKESVAKTVKIIEELNVMGPQGLEKAKYPREALHEILANAVLHRDYGITDDIHIRIFENRIEVESPGRLPAHITVSNILDERYARNGTIVRLLNKYPDAPNKDVGEGLNTAYQAMRLIELKEPIIIEKENSVMVTLRHEPIAPPEELVLEYLINHDTINNSKAREITFIGSENKVKRVFERLIERGEIERIPELRGRATAYRKASK